MVPSQASCLWQVPRVQAPELHAAASRTSQRACRPRGPPQGSSLTPIATFIRADGAPGCSQSWHTCSPPQKRSRGRQPSRPVGKAGRIGGEEDQGEPKGDGAQGLRVCRRC